MRMTRLAIGGLLAIALSVASVLPSDAIKQAPCKWEPWPWGNWLDSIPPSKPSANLAAVYRGSGPVQVGTDQVMTWGEMHDGTIILNVDATDNETPARQMGYLVNLVGERLPPFSLPASPLCPFVSSDSTGQERLTLYLHWNDYE